MNQQEQLARLLRLLAAAVENLDQHQLEQLLLGRGKLTFTVGTKTKEVDATTSIDHGALLEKLNGCKDREQAQQILGQITNRDRLASFARALKIHVVKQDRREDIESKIIEFIIGGKLRTEAIQSLNLKSGNGPTPQTE